MKLTRILSQEFAETLKRPARMLNVLNARRVLSFLEFQRFRWLGEGAWTKRDGGALATRELGSYQDYVRLQQSKLRYLDLTSHEHRFRKALRERLGELAFIRPGARVLCLGARLGAEVAAFRDLGCFAIGIDLNPGIDNPWVLYGDFHKLEYPEGCVDLVYSNSLDHCLEPNRVLAEVRRVLRPDGRLLIEADPGVGDPNGIAPDMWSTFQWESVDSLREMIQQQGFAFQSQAGFGYPRSGTALVFTVGAP